MNKVKKVLIVTHQFVPHQSPRTTRWKLIYDELEREGIDVHVVTGTPQNGSDSNIIYIGNKKASKVVKNLRDQSNVHQKSFFKNLVLRLLKKIYRFFYKAFAWPDYTMFWVFSIWRNRKNINLDYDLIISVSLPFSSHIAAYLINKKRGKEWIMDIGDPFSLKINAYENNKYLYKSLNYFVENKFYKLASKIIFTHKQALEVHKNFFKINSKKLFVGNPISSFDNNLYKIAKDYDYSVRPIEFGYFGILTKGVRSPINVLEVLDTEKINFNWYTNPDSKKMIEDTVVKKENHSFFDIVPREKALDIMVGNLHCLLSIGNLNPTQLPSKVIEYLSTGKPVVHFAEIEDDPVYDLKDFFNNLLIITKKDNLLNIENSLDKLFSSVGEFDENYFKNNYSSKAVIKLLEVF